MFSKCSSFSLSASSTPLSQPPNLPLGLAQGRQVEGHQSVVQSLCSPRAGQGKAGQTMTASCFQFFAPQPRRPLLKGKCFRTECASYHDPTVTIQTRSAALPAPREQEPPAQKENQKARARSPASCRLGLSHQPICAASTPTTTGQQRAHQPAMDTDSILSQRL